MQPDTADATEPLTLTFSSDAAPDKAPRRRLTALPEGTGTMLRLTEGSSLRGTVFNLVNTMIGGGILGLPYAVEQMGILLGCGVLFLNAVLSDLTVWMLLVCVDDSREKSFAMVGEVLVGQWLGLMVDGVVALNNLGLLISYIMILGDTLPPFMVHVQAPQLLQDRSSLLVIIAAFVLLPLSCLRNLGALRHASLVCLLLILMLLSLIVAMGTGWISVAEPGDVPTELFPRDVTALIGQLPVVIFAYNCNMNVPILYGELRRQKHEAIDSRFQTKRAKMMSAVHVSFAITSLIYTLVAGFGYRAFRARIRNDVLENLSVGVAIYVKAAYSVVIICSYPVLCFSGVASVHRLLLHVVNVLQHPSLSLGYSPFMVSSPMSRSSEFLPSAPSYTDFFSTPYRLPGETYLAHAPRSQPKPAPPPAPSEAIRLAEVVGVVAASLAMGVVLPNVSVIFGLTGGLCGGALTYVFPGLLFARTKKGSLGGCLGHAVFWLGVFLSLGCTAVVAWQTAAGTS